MTDDTALRLARADADREKRTGAPSYPTPGLVAKLVEIIDRLTAERSRKPRTRRTP